MEMIVEIKLQKQVGTRVDRNKVIADSRNYLKVKFDFSEEWIGTKTAIFKHKDQKEYYECLIDEENSCYVPQEVIKKGSFYVSAICGDLITSNRVDVDVEESGYMEGAAPPPEPTPDIYSQILKVCEETESIAQSVRDDADAGLFNGEQGEQGEQGEPGTSDYNELENKPDLSIYATIEEVDEKIANIPGVADVYTVEETDNAIKEAVDTLANGQVAINTSNLTYLSELVSENESSINDIKSSPVMSSGITATKVSAYDGYASQIVGKANKATTLSGYGITNAYTKSEVDTAINNLSGEWETPVENVQNKVSSIESKIPSSASSTNQLADKNFVNSSIATNTAYFIDTFDSVEDLNNYSGTLTRNDYAFVVSQDEHGNTVYNRYKYNGSTWIFEYPLNNSSFTAQQWDTINSGVTKENIEQITTNKNDLDDLGEQVSGIEEKIPSTVSATNPLVVKNYVDTREQEIRSDYQGADSDLQTQINDISANLSTTNQSLTDIEEKIPDVASDSNKLVAKSELPTLVDLAQAGEGIAFERKIVQGGENYTTTGSPNIDANGIFTATTTAHYISSPEFDSFEGQNFEIEFTTPSSIGTSSSIVRFVGTGNTASIGITNSYKLYIGTPIGLQLETTLSTDTSYVLKFIRTGEVNTLSLYSSDGTLLEEKTNTNSITGLSPCTIQIGRVNIPFKFDLNKMSFGDWRARTQSFDGYEISSTGGGTDVSSNTVNGAPLSNSSSYFFGVCETAGNIAEKVVSIPSITELNAGQIIIVRPTYEATSGSKTKLKLNDFEAYPLKYGVDVVNTTNDGYMLVAGRPSIFVFDGEYWVFAGQGFRTVYNAMTVSNGIAATSGSAQLVSPANLKQIIQGTTLTGIDVATSGTVSETDSVIGAIGKLQAQITTSVGNIETALNTINSGV